MTKRLLSALSAGGMAIAILSDVQAQVFPEAMDYVVQMQNSVQSNSNPGRASQIHDPVDGSMVTVNSIGMALRIPVLSDDTRLDIAGVGGDAQYSGQHQFDHQPRKLNARFHWRATDLFDGKMGYDFDRRRYESDQIWPDSDTVDSRTLSARMGMNISEDLTLPIVRVFSEQSNYHSPQNRRLFDATERGWELAARYQSVTGSSLAVGLTESETRYPLRRLLNRPGLDDTHNDREVFTEAYWQYSVKTGVYARLGWLNRQYDTFDQRNTDLMHMDTQAIWQYSPKTELRLGVWQRPFNNDEDPNITYSALRGLGLTAGWQPSPKLAFSVFGSFERQQDTRLSGDVSNSTRMRFGPRLAWKAHPNVSVVIDGYQARKRGDIPSNNYKQAVVRLGLVLQTDSGNIELADLLNPKECRWSHLETALCP